MNTIFLEFIEIFINQAIYLRGVYPKQVFRKHKAYALPIYSSIYPPLNEYIKSSMKTIQCLLNAGELKKIEVLIYNENERESFIIEILEAFMVPESDKFLTLTHDIFRHSIIDMESKCKILNKFTRTSKFKILLHTIEKAYQKLCNEKMNQDFLWMKYEEEKDRTADGINKSEIEIIPISSSTATNEQSFMSLCIEQCQ